MAASLASPRSEDSLSLSYSEVADPLGTIDKSVSKMLDECTSKIDIKTYGEKIRKVTKNMKPKWETMAKSVDRERKLNSLISIEEDLVNLVRESKERKALLKFRHAISVFRELVCCKLNTDWNKFHHQLRYSKDDDEATKEATKQAKRQLETVLQDSFRMSPREWDVLSRIAKDGSDMAHPQFNNDEEVEQLLNFIKKEEDREILRNLINSLVSKLNVGDRIIEKRRKVPK